MKKKGEKYSRLVGYNFGDYIFEGAYWDTETGKRQYKFSKHENGFNEDATTIFVTEYKGFRQLIDQYDWPKT